MNHSVFQSIYSNTPVPILVCRGDGDREVVYINPNARLLLDPGLAVASLRSEATHPALRDLLRFRSAQKLDGLLVSLQTTGIVEAFEGDLIDHEGQTVPVSISANQVDLDGVRYYIFYITRISERHVERTNAADTLTTMFHLANQSGSADDAINHVLSYIGNSVQASRAYIFEEISAEDTRNTYEWCAPGVEPAIDDLQCLKKADYNYDVIINSGMYISDDIRELPEGDRDILAAQGIKALALLPMFLGDRPLGYVGFDDCNDYRKWSGEEIDLLKNTTSILVSLIVRRNADNNLSRSHDILQIISDNIENIIYVNDIHTYEVVFLNKTLAATLGSTVDDILGKPCWQRLQSGFDGPCPFCPMPKMLREGYDVTGKTYTWEFQNTVTQRWYLLKDSIIPWTDGRLVHIETATEITHQKLYEEQLKQFASTDMMTGAYNREWGTRIMQEMLDAYETEREEVSLVFIDIDGLKDVNDTYGHDAGDELIVQTVQMIRTCTRKSDVLCRWGGDEFILLLHCNMEIAERIMTNVQHKIDEVNKDRSKPYDLGFSYGLTSLTGMKDTPLDDIITEADKRMYANKMAKGKAR